MKQRMIANLAKLANEPSWLNSLMIEYLEGLIKRLNNVGWEIDDQPLSIEDFAIEQRVITKIERKRDEEEKQRFVSGLEPTSKFYEIESDAERYETITWSSAVSEPNLRLAIKGSPGSGKTCSSRLSVIKIAHESLYKLRNHTARLEEIEIPLWITAKELSQRSETEISDALIEILKQKFETSNLTDYFFDWLQKRMRTVFQPNTTNSESKNSVFVVVDALDELSGQTELDNFERLVNKLDRPSVKLLVTCRTWQWESRRSLLEWNNLKSLELAPLKKYQKIEFLEKFFSHNKTKLESAKNIFGNNYAIDYATDNSLILTFVCYLHLKGQIDNETTYIDIYTKMQRELFIGTWKKEKPFWVTEGKTSRYAKRLEKVTLQIFLKNPEANHFTLDDWDNAAEKLQISEDESDKFCEELVRIGFLASSGINDLGDECWSFLHRTLLEFTAAKAIAKQDDWFEIARKHYCDFAWLETLTFIAGLGDGKQKAKRMIDDLENEMQTGGYLKNEIFGIGILLQSKFTGVSELSGKYIELICDIIIYGIQEAYCGYPIPEPLKPKYIDNQTFYKPFLKTAKSALKANKNCHHILESFFDYLLTFINKDRWEAETALSCLEEIGENSNKIIDCLVQIKSSDPRITESIIGFLGQSGNADKKVMDFLKNTFEDYKKYSSYNRLSLEAAEALCCLGYEDESICSFLLQMDLKKKPTYLGEISIRLNALKKIGKVDEKLRETLVNFVINEENHLYDRLDLLYHLIRLDYIIVDLSDRDNKVTAFLVQDFLKIKIEDEFGNDLKHHVEIAKEIIELIMKKNINKNQFDYSNSTLYDLVYVCKLCYETRKIESGFIVDNFFSILIPIWQTYRTPANNLIFTWDMLEMSNEDLGERFFPTN